MKRKLSKICTSCLQPTHLFAAIILLLAPAVPVQKVYAAPSHGKAAPAGTSVSGQSPLSAARNEKIVSSPAAPAIAVDGDSLEIGSRRIRLMGIDAPEYDQFCKKNNGELYPCGQLAADYLKTLIAEKNITCRIHKQDKYKRDLCTCYAETTDLNAEMIRAGYAVVYLERLCRTRGRSPPQPKRHLERHIYASPSVPPAEIPSEKAKAAKLI